MLPDSGQEARVDWNSDAMPPLAASNLYRPLLCGCNHSFSWARARFHSQRIPIGGLQNNAFAQYRQPVVEGSHPNSGRSDWKPFKDAPNRRDRARDPKAKPGLRQNIGNGANARITPAMTFR